MKLTLITPEKTVIDSDNVEHLLLPAEDGELGILPGHIAMICNLQVGRIRVDMPGETIELATSGGFAEVLDDRVIVLANTAERAEEIDVDRSRRRREWAEQQLLHRAGEIDDATAVAVLARAENRLRVAR